VLYAYEQALSNTGAWPLESTFTRNSVNDLLRLLGNFQVPPGLRVQTCGDLWCSFVYEENVERAKEKTKSYFDGLCLGQYSFLTFITISCSPY